jgi:Fur family ferric uptake transcriptional regulator
VTLDLLSRVEIGDGVARYEPQRPHDDAHHHHLVCDGCGKLTPFQDDALERAIHGLAARVAFDVSDHDVTLHGSCENCKDR